MKVDIVVVGAGIHGAGVAQAAAAAGCRVLLLEKRSPAAGTSSRSSKLIHGGLRYLETFRLGLVRESLVERKILLRIAPGLVTLADFHLPVYAGGRRGPWAVRAGLSLYALLGGLGADARFRRVRRDRWGELDGLRTDGLVAVFRYRDGRTDDAELTRRVVDSARSLGAEVRCPAEVASVALDEGGVRVRWRESGAEREGTGRVLVNAAGPWANRLLERIEPRIESLPIDLVQGAHVELEGILDRGFYYAESPADGRPLFVMPWRNRILVGTTETAFAGDPDRVEATPAEVEYLLDAFRYCFPARPVRVLGTFAGLRVLPKGEGTFSRRTREVILHPDRSDRPRVLTIYGGKLTGYRRTALKVLGRILPSLPSGTPLPRTDRIRLT